MVIVLLVLVGPVMIGVGAALNAADNDLLETGTRTSGTVSQVDDGAKASRKRFRVDYVAADASTHVEWVSWSSDEKPVVGDSVTVIYRESDPESAVVEGYDLSGQSFLGLGVVLTFLFGVIGFIGLIGSKIRKDRRAIDAGS